MAKYSVGSKVHFHRNLLTHGNTTVCAVVPKSSKDMAQVYVVESPTGHGWNPDALREKNFKLKKDKIYLFVLEDELGKEKSASELKEERELKTKSTNNKKSNGKKSKSSRK